MALKFAYLFERFPSFVQTFVYREAVEMLRQGHAPILVSVRRPDDPSGQVGYDEADEADAAGGGDQHADAERDEQQQSHPEPVR